MPETILIVQDDRAIRWGVARALRRAHFDVLEAESPGEALAVAQRSPTSISLAVIDALLPGQLGTALASQLRQFLPDLRVLFLCAYQPVICDALHLASESLYVMTGPFTPELLLARVRQILFLTESFAPGQAR